MEDLTKEELEELERIKCQPWFESRKPPRTLIFQERDFYKELESEWGRFGAQGIGRLRKVLLSRPTENEVRSVYEKEPEYYRLYRMKLPNLKKMQEQFDQYVKVLQGEGVEVHFLEPPVPAIGPFGFIKWFCTVGSVLVTKAGAIIPRAAMAGWEVGRNRYFVKKLVELGVPILFMIHGKGVIELGGSVWLDQTHLMAAEGLIANKEGIEQFKWILNSIGVEVFVAHTPGYLDLWEWPSGGVSHPDWWLGMVDTDLALIYPPMCDYGTIRYLREKKIRLIEVPPEEYLEYGCNVIQIEPGKVVIPAMAKKTISALKREGIECLDVEFSEAAHGSGGPHCMTGQLLRDPCPSIDDL